MERRHPLEKHRNVFVDACAQKSINLEVADSLFDQLSSELELAEALHNLTARKDSSATEPPTSRRSSYVPLRKQSLGNETLRNELLQAERHREKPAQVKLEREIELAREKSEHLRNVQSFRQLTATEIEELKEAELAEYEAKRKLKRTKDAALRAKRYRIRRAANGGNGIENGAVNPFLETCLEESMNSNSPEDLRSSSATSFNESFSFSSKPPASSSPPRKRPYSPASGLASNGFLCSQCDFNFPNLGLFVAHMKAQHLHTSPGPESFPCRVCKTPFPTASSRLGHMTEHFVGSLSTFTCQQCSKSFENSTLFRQHFMIHHAEILHRCNICLRVFTQNSAFQEHMTSHMASETRYSCVACPSLGFDTFELFEAHIQLVHDKNESNGTTKTFQNSPPKNNGISPSTAAYESSGGGSKNLRRCVVCDKECPSESALDEHRLLNHCKVPKSDRCTVCRRLLTSTLDFMAHMHQHADGFNDMDCVICRQKIRNDVQMKMHAEYHLDFEGTPSPPEGATTKCSICNDFVPSNNLAKHYLHHASGSMENGTENIKTEIEDFPTSEISSPSVPLICHCGQQFEDENEITIHALEHLNETLPGCSGTDPTLATASFDCPRCPKRFTSLSALQGHSHIHMSPKVFKCTKCSHTFNSAFRLQQHRFKHTSKNDLKCRICDKKFLSTDDLQSHMLVHESSLTSFVAAKNPVLLASSSNPSTEALEV